MDRLQQISAEIIRLYRKQLSIWVLGKIANLQDADFYSTTAGEIALRSCGRNWKECFGRPDSLA